MWYSVFMNQIKCAACIHANMQSIRTFFGVNDRIYELSKQGQGAFVGLLIARWFRVSSGAVGGIRPVLVRSNV